MDSPEGPSAAHFEHPASLDTFDSKQHARKQDIHMIPESAMLLSRLLEREARKQTVLRQIRPSTIRKPIREIPAVSCAKLLRKGTYKKTFRAPPSSKHRSTALSGRESGTSSFHHGNVKDNPSPLMLAMTIPVSPNLFNWIDLVSIIPFYLEMFLELVGGHAFECDSTRLV
ncbi:hypothetical protein DYB35_000475 [Aphanomyces astaci]|uniref:Uncharacterized protein n=1 Tax=Aphanomyces astaci TaxID=112090 RepID=A0A418DDH4_APHAT|nr:hypothetical protein DYB35_000475 [Aphanomyces astaci]